MTALVETRHLTKHFPVRGGLFGPRQFVHAVNGVNVSVQSGETLGIVGESGCGKSTLGRLMLRLLEPTSGEVWFDGENLQALSGAALRRKRREAQIIFQDPYGSLNPRMRVGTIVGEGLEIHNLAKGEEKKRRVIKL